MSYDNERSLGQNINAHEVMSRQYIMNNGFYMVVPEPYRQYYIRFVRNYFYWYDGYVPYYHTTTNGIMSTRIAYTLLNKLAELTTGSKLLFDDEDTPNKEFVNFNGEKDLNSLDFVEKWAKKYNLDAKITQAVSWAYAGGDSLLKLDSVEGHLQPKILRKDEYWYSTDFSGRIVDVNMFLYERNHSGKQGEEQQFYLLEQRRYNDKGEPESRIFIKRGTGSRPTYKDVDTYETSNVSWEQLPKKIAEEIKRLFPKVTIGEWNKMPIDTLGVYVIKSSEKVSFLPALPFGESLLSNNLSALATYDYYWNYFNNDMFLGQGRVLIPDTMGNTSPHVKPLNDIMYHMLPYRDANDQKPVSIQFELRSDDWSSTRNNILQTFSMNFGVNERTILTSIVPASEKPTAHEVSSDENSTTLFVQNHRRLIKSALDYMLEDVLKFYDVYNEKVYVKFTQLGLTNIANIVNITTMLKQNGLIDVETALEMIFTDKNNRQIKAIHERIKKEKEEGQALASQPSFDTMQDMEKDNYENDLNHLEKPKDEEK